MSNATLKLRPAPMNALDRVSGGPTTCQHCGREDLLRTVKMTDGAAVMWLGRGCAAKAMGVGLREFGRAQKAVQDEADAAERRAREAERQAEYNAFQAWLDATVAPKGDRFRQLEALGGYAAANAAYKASR